MAIEKVYDLRGKTPTLDKLLAQVQAELDQQHIPFVLLIQRAATAPGVGHVEAIVSAHTCRHLSAPMASAMISVIKGVDVSGSEVHASHTKH